MEILLLHTEFSTFAMQVQARWFQERVGAGKGRIRRTMIVALARKLMVALWRYVTQGLVPEGAVIKG